ncbi:TolC family protein [Calycomorphotria hydatis]|uniref:TolC family protein n=1 Tax=Calycomorphotria hydatis TaxID=2528027 RepID=UPI0018D1FE22|nr:TolC family protein [Calycomorphotria hydatis]
MNTIKTVGFEEENYSAPPPPGPLPYGSEDSTGHDQSETYSSQAALTLGDVEQMALTSNPTLQIAAWQQRATKGAAYQQGLKPNPQLGYSGNEIGNDGAAGQQGIYFSQLFVTADKLGLARSIGSWDVQEANWIYQAQRQRVLNDVRSTFYDSLGAQRRVEIALQLEEIMEKGVENAEALVRVGEAGLPDKFQTEAQLGQVQILKRNAEIELLASKRRLAGFTGNRSITQSMLVGDLGEMEFPEYDFNQSYERLIDLSPEIQQAAARVQRARNNVALQSRWDTPNVSTQAGVAYDAATESTIANVQASIMLPTFNQNEGYLAAADAEYARACFEVERVRRELSNRLAIAMQNHEQARQQVQIYRDVLIPKFDKSLELIDRGYQAGQFGFLRVLTARQQFIQTNLEYISVLVAAKQAAIQIDGLVLSGGLTPVDTPQSPTGLRGFMLGNQ